MSKSLRKTVKNCLNIDLPEGKEKSTSATLYYAMSSSKKIELVAKIVRGKPLGKAVHLLSYMPNKSSKLLLEVIKSAESNAINNANIDSNTLYIKRVDVGRGKKYKRVRFGARSRVHQYENFRAFIRVVLDTK